GGMNLLFCGIIEDGHRIFNEFHAQAPELVDSREGGPWRNRPIGITIERAIVRQRRAQSLKKASIASGIFRDLDLEIAITLPCPTDGFCNRLVDRSISQDPAEWYFAIGPAAPPP